MESDLERMRKARREKADAMEERRTKDYDLRGIEELEEMASQGVYIPFRKLEDCYMYDVRMLELETQADVFDIEPLAYGTALKRVKDLNQSRDAIAGRYAVIVAGQIKRIEENGISEEDVFPAHKPFLCRQPQEERAALVDFKNGLEVTAKDFRTGKIGYDKGDHPLQDQAYRVAMGAFARKILPFLVR